MDNTIKEKEIKMTSDEVLKKLKEWIEKNASEFEDNASLYVLVDDLETFIEELEKECEND